MKSNLRSLKLFVLFLSVIGLSSTELKAVCSVNAAFTVSDTNGVYYFKNASTGNANRFRWNFGDGYTSFSRNTYHMYAAGPAATYNVSLIVWDTTQSNCRDTMYYSLTVNYCSVNKNYTYNNTGFNYNFTTYSVSGFKYYWSFGDGTYSTAKNPSHTYSSPGTYNVKFRVTDTTKNNCKDSSVQSLVVTGCNIWAYFNYYDSSGVYVFNTQYLGANKFEWDFGDGQKSTLRNPTHRYAYGPNAYRTIVLTYSDTTKNNCKDTTNKTIYIPGCTVKAKPSFSRTGYVVSFANTSIGTNRYKWYFGDGQTSVLKTPTHTYSTTGTFLVSLVAWDSMAPVCRDSAAFSLVVNTCNVISNFSYKDSMGTFYFTNLSVNANRYLWLFGDGYGSQYTHPSHKYSANGTYTVKLIAYDTTKSNCVDTQVFVLQMSGCTAKAAYSYSKSKMTVSFFNSSTGANKYLWRFGDGSSSALKNPVHTYIAQAGYTVKLIVRDTTKSNCVDSVSYMFNVDSCTVNAAFYALDSAREISFVNYSTGNKFLWNFGDGTYSTVKNPKHKYYGAQRYIAVSLLVSDTTNSFCSSYLLTRYVHFIGCDAAYVIEADTSTQYSAIIRDKSWTSPSATYIWDFGDGDTSHARTPTHTYSGSGTYLLCVSIFDDSCTSTFCDTLQFDTSGNVILMQRPFSIKVIGAGTRNTSVTSVNLQDHLKVFPNPVSDRLQLSSAAEMRQVKLYNYNGQCLVSIAVSDNEIDLPFNLYPPGIYQLQVMLSNGVVVTKKLVKY